jgi:ActR/RegA family two-component response regulator
MAGVLVIDDDPRVLQTLQRTLVRSGFGVVTAQSGMEGLERARQAGVDVIISDVRLPDIDGVDVLRQLRQDRVTTPMIMLTGYGTIASAVEAIKLGAADYLEKPCARTALLRSLGAALTSLASDLVSRHLPAPPAEHHPATQWARLVVSVLTASSDPTTLHAWGKCAGASPGTIKRRCAALGISARRSRDFARVLRAVVHADHSGSPVEAFLDADSRTLHHLLKRAVLDGRNNRPSPMQFLERQRFVVDREALSTIHALLIAVP